MGTTPSALGLQAPPGGRATIGGVSYVGDANGNWVPNPGAAPAGTQSNVASTVPGNPPAWITGNPYMQNPVTSRVVPDGAPSYDVSLGNRFVNQQTAQQLGQAFGANVAGQDLQAGYGPSGAPSDPLYYNLDFGSGAPVDAASIVAGLRRYNADTGQYESDAMHDIMARINAGRAGGGGATWANPQAAFDDTSPDRFAGSFTTPVAGAQFGGQRPTWPTEWRPWPGNAATPATPAVPGVSPAVPATPAVPPHLRNGEPPAAPANRQTPGGRGGAAPDSSRGADGVQRDSMPNPVVTFGGQDPGTIWNRGRETGPDSSGGQQQLSPLERERLQEELVGRRQKSPTSPAGGRGSYMPETLPANPPMYEPHVMPRSYNPTATATRYGQIAQPPAGQSTTRGADPSTRRQSSPNMDYGPNRRSFDQPRVVTQRGSSILGG